MIYTNQAQNFDVLFYILKMTNYKQYTIKYADIAYYQILINYNSESSNILSRSIFFQYKYFQMIY